MADISQAPKIQNGGYKPEVAISQQPYMIGKNFHPYIGDFGHARCSKNDANYYRRHLSPENTIWRT